MGHPQQATDGSDWDESWEYDPTPTIWSAPTATARASATTAPTRSETARTSLTAATPATARASGRTRGSSDDRLRPPPAAPPAAMPLWPLLSRERTIRNVRVSGDNGAIHRTSRRGGDRPAHGSERVISMQGQSTSLGRPAASLVSVRRADQARSPPARASARPSAIPARPPTRRSSAARALASATARVRSGSASRAASRACGKPRIPGQCDVRSACRAGDGRLSLE
jgi:hypothetical protein